MEKQKEVIENGIFCYDCEEEIAVGETAFFYQDETGHDTQPGFYCTECANHRDEDGELEEIYR